MNGRNMQFAQLARTAAVASAIALGGCELLNWGESDSAGRSPQGSAQAVMPPPPAPRAKPVSRRIAGERDGVGDTALEPLGDQPLDTSPRVATAHAASDGTIEPSLAAVPSSPGDPPLPVPPVAEARPERVVGLTENALAQWLGPPANTREESPARVWRYEGIGCAFDVFFYLDLVSREFRALRYEVKGSSNDDQRCLQPVFAGRGSPPRATARRVD
jgi:hypothetical protein